VRQAALWAFGFAGGSGAVDLLRNAAHADPSDQLRTFARQALTTVEERSGGWWWV
jgi:hypothetical protein